MPLSLSVLLGLPRPAVLTSGSEVDSAMKAGKMIYSLSAAIVWIPIIFFSLLLSHNAILYFTHGGEYGILPEKIMARQDLLWNVSFYLHLPAGIVCLLMPIFLFAERFFKRSLHLHT